MCGSAVHRQNHWQNLPGYRLALLQVYLVLLLACLVFPDPVQAGRSYRQPAYITNAYFSDKITEEENEVLRPLAVVKAFRSRSSGVVGYFILDLVLVKRGVHHFKVDIMNPGGKKVTDLVYSPVQLSKEGDLPLYTAAGSISGNFPPGIWFFKVFDRVNNGTWSALGTFSIMILDPGESLP